MQMDDEQIQSLEAKITTLLELSEQMFEENEQLRSERQQWREERDLLLEKNNQARLRIQSMIDRLQHLDDHTQKPD
ncbi:cell division protein ZapB [Sinobacterium caligoides]|uniref:Cell division protein ZapB n=1 Tax=Sinobacterium caligoides TaxID=933926 RepID=A0A3N2DGI1_9GAMM|nr:TIGR02449 family protein [Sinobacterium caligoides]ROR98859.1 cell division protein ZapB [Sinobacterium caligoides]